MWYIKICIIYYIYIYIYIYIYVCVCVCVCEYLLFTIIYPCHKHYNVRFYKPCKRRLGGRPWPTDNFLFGQNCWTTSVMTSLLQSGTSEEGLKRSSGSTHSTNGLSENPNKMGIITITLHQFLFSFRQKIVMWVWQI